MPVQNLFATLIGINAYPQNPLSGCIKDVLDLDLFLRQWCDQMDGKLAYKPLYLLAPNDSADTYRLEDYKPNEAQISFIAPTFANISTAAFDHLKQAKDGDVCLFYYSGHGSQTDAPEVFWKGKPDHQNETIVCVDSRDPNSANGRDLIDKELAYLVWDALEDKQVHCLVMMDCCHSGNNMRAMLDPDINYRYVAGANNKIPFEDYLGYHNNFYEVSNGNASVKVARYVHLAAARDTEKAQETKNGGLFTSKLMDLLRAGGTAKSYRELVQSLAITIRNRAAQQNPVAFAAVDDDLELSFLGKNMRPFQASYEVRYDFSRKKWIMYGGEMHGVTPSGDHAQTLIAIRGFDKEIKVVEVYANFCILSDEDTAGLDKNVETYTAVLKKLANSHLKIGISSGLHLEADRFAELEEAYHNEPHIYFEIDFDIGFKAPELVIYLTEDDQYVLARSNSEIPLFKREKNAASFLRNVDALCKWINVSDLQHANTRFTSNDFVFTVETIEGEAITAESIDGLQGKKTIVKPGEEILLKYVDDNQPAFRFSIGLNKTSALQNCYLGALYLGSKFGITDNFLNSDNNQLVNNESTLSLGYFDRARRYTAIPVSIAEEYKIYNINEITDVLKIFVSNDVIDLKRFKQESLKLDDTPNIKLRDPGFAPTSDSVGDDADWTVFTFKIRIIGPNKAKTLESGPPVAFSDFTVTVPNGFSANAWAVSGDDQQRKLNRSGMRGMNDDNDALTRLIAPPPGIWGDALTDNVAFPKGLNGAADNSIQAIELLPVNGEHILLPEGEEIIIKPKKTAIKTKGEDDDEETIIPFGFDEASQLYYPLGFTDEDGNIHIQQLPPETAGRIQTDEPLTRSLGGSIKLFFRKLFRRKQINKYVLYRFNPATQWEPVSEDPEDMKAILAEKPEGRVLLLTHGLTGDTGPILGCLQQMFEIPPLADFILTFDYENLATPMAKTAKSMDEQLRAMGFNSPGMPAVTCIAHSQGGLVARWLVEEAGGHEYIDKLVLVGTASAGSELAKLGSSILGLLTHAINVTGPLKMAVTGLSFLLKKLELNPGRTLKETNPGSDFLRDLNMGGLADGVKYYLIGGDVILLKNGYDGDDYFLKKLSKSLMDNVVYPGLRLALYKGEPNDMAVTIASMKSVPGIDAAAFQLVASNHLAYFREKLCRDELVRILKEQEQ